jgi:rare lipoprotein A
VKTYSFSGEVGLRRHRRAAVTALIAIAALTLSACSGTDARRAPSAYYTQQSVAKRPAHPQAYAAPTRRSNYDIVGNASWYGKPYHGRRTASGQVYNMYQMTAAHPTLPFGTRVLVTNLDNGRSVVVTINDRGPFVRGRIIDVSRKAAGQLGFLNKGVTRVGVRVIQSSRS